MQKFVEQEPPKFSWFYCLLWSIVTLGFAIIPYLIYFYYQINQYKKSIEIFNQSYISQKDFNEKFEKSATEASEENLHQVEQYYKNGKKYFVKPIIKLKDSKEAKNNQHKIIKSEGKRELISSKILQELLKDNDKITVGKIKLVLETKNESIQKNSIVSEGLEIAENHNINKKLHFEALLYRMLIGDVDGHEKNFLSLIDGKVAIIDLGISLCPFLDTMNRSSNPTANVNNSLIAINKIGITSDDIQDVFTKFSSNKEKLNHIIERVDLSDLVVFNNESKKTAKINLVRKNLKNNLNLLTSDIFKDFCHISAQFNPQEDKEPNKLFFERLQNFFVWLYSNQQYLEKYQSGTLQGFVTCHYKETDNYQKLDLNSPDYQKKWEEYVNKKTNDIQAAIIE
jgi:hypothetical protein